MSESMSEHVAESPIRRCTITRAPRGWEVNEEEDSQVVRRLHCSEWHQVERAVAIFALQGDEIRHSTKR